MKLNSEKKKKKVISKENYSLGIKGGRLMSSFLLSWAGFPVTVIDKTKKHLYIEEVANRPKHE